jgi:GNAT superfamily N-acetyltransferase
MTHEADAPTIRQGTQADVERLGPLWQSLQAHHLEVGTVDRPGRSPAESWGRRRKLYDGWFDGAVADIWLLERDDELLGYAMVHYGAASMTWAVDRIATLETLVVTPELRGTGLGGQLIDAVFADLRARGFEEVEVTHIEGNDGAGRLYAANGFEPLARMLRAPLR